MAKRQGRTGARAAHDRQPATAPSLILNGPYKLRLANETVEESAIERICAEVDSQAERRFWMQAQSSSVSTVWGDDDDQLFAMQN